MMTFHSLSIMNHARCISEQGFGHSLDSWSLSDWFTATMGELGEAANVAKKLNRIRDGIKGNKETEKELREKLKREIGDTVIYLDLLCQSQNLSLANCVATSFNEKSEEIGAAQRLPGDYSSKT